MQKWIISCITMLVIAVNAYAQDTYADKVQKYVTLYKDYAIAEQRRSGVPAAITLGQGILETEAGCSELVTGANNHFGIKCKREWTGETFSHTDDAPNECFRKYGCAADSYKDHSEYLRTQPRYAALFKLSPTDYAAWAFGLKRCGYATSPTYAQRLINIIENFRLQEFTYQALNEDNGIGVPVIAKNVTGNMPPTPVANKKTDTVFLEKKDSVYAFRKHQPVKQLDTIAIVPAAQPDSPVIKKENTEAISAAIDSLEKNKAEEPRDTLVVNPAAQQVFTEQPAIAERTHPTGITKINGIKAIYVYKGEMLLQYAVKYNIRYAKLLEVNELPDAPVAEDMYIYLEKKNIKGVHATHLVKEGETLRSISQDEAIQLKKLMAYNKLADGEQPVAGVTLQLQSYATVKPKVTKVGSTKRQTPALVQVPPMTVANTVAPTNPPSENTVAAATEPAEATVQQKDTIQKTEADNTPQVAIPNTVAQVNTLAPEEKKPEVKEQQTAQHQSYNPVTQPVPDISQVAPVDPKQQEEKEELDNLKSRLDKLVYANDYGDEKPKPAPALTTEQKQAVARAEEDAKYYTVRGGDTAYSIARSHGISMHQLLEWNNLNFNQIKVGQKLRIKP